MKSNKTIYIGICGHHGAGKNTMAYLIANAIEYIISDGDKEEYPNRFNQWCNEIMQDESLIYSLSLKSSYIESFSTDIKSYINLLTGIPVEHMYSDLCKENIAINLKDLSEIDVKDIENKELLISREKLFELRNTKDITQISSD